MKRFIILSAILLAAAASSRMWGGQGKPSIVGIWQMTYVAYPKGQSEVRYTPVWKIFTSDGKFNIMMWRSDDIAAFISTSGTYRLVNDSVAAESVTHSATDPKLVGTQTAMKFRFVNPDLLFVRYNLPGRDLEGQELWMRVQPVSQASKLPLGRKGHGKAGKVVRDSLGVYLATEQMPEFVGGGSEGLTEYLRQNISYPIEAQEQGLEGVALITFIVNEQGKTEDFRVIKSANSLLDGEAVRVLRGAKFTPGLHDGRPVKVYMTVPVSFRLK